MCKTLTFRSRTQTKSNLFVIEGADGPERNSGQGNTIQQGKRKGEGKIVCLWGLDSLSLLGQGTIIAWDRTLLTHFEDPACETHLLSFVSARNWLRRGRRGQAYVCAHTRPPQPRLLTELTCLKLVYPRLRIRRTSTRQYTLLETESSRRERRWALCKLSMEYRS